MSAGFIKGLWQGIKLSLCVAHVFHFYAIEQSILSQPVWRPCEKWTSVICTHHFPPRHSHRLGEIVMTCNTVHWKKRMFFLGSRGFSHALSHVDCVAWTSLNKSASPWSVSGGRGEALRATATTGVTRRHVATYFMNKRQRDEFFPTCAAFGTAAVGVSCCYGQGSYPDTITVTMLSLTFLFSFWSSRVVNNRFPVLLLCSDLQPQQPRVCWLGVAEALGSDVQPCGIYPELAAWGKCQALGCFTSGTN